jgi:hypothetical protein
MIELDDKTYAKSWLLNAIFKSSSNHNELFVSEPSFSFSSCLKDYLSSQNEEKDGDQRIQSPYGQLNDNVGTYQ